MKLLFLLLAVGMVLIAAAVFSPMLLDDPGRVILGVGAWEIETSVVGLALFVLLSWLGLSLIWWLARSPRRWRLSRRQTHSRQQLESGFLALIEGEWEDAERAFSKSLRHEKSIAGLLGAAQAAQGRSDLVSRDAWLDQIKQRFGHTAFVTQFAKAKFALEEGQYARAIEVLERLHLKKPKHLGVLRALLQAYQDGERWRELRELAPALKRAGMVDLDRANALVQLAARRELARCSDYQALRWTWRALSRAQRKDVPTLLAYVQRSHELGHDEHATGLLSQCLDREINTPVLLAYRACGEPARAARIADLEKRLTQQPNLPALLETLGFMYLDDRQYEKAEHCLEEAGRHAGSVELYTALGRIKDRQGQTAEASRYYRNALQHQPNAEQKRLESSVLTD